MPTSQNSRTRSSVSCSRSSRLCESVTDIENLILGTQGATRRFFVVDEEIQSSKQPAARRSVVDFVGQTNGVALGSNVFLSFSFSSSAVPEAPDLEVLAWDEVNGTYNFYKLDVRAPLPGSRCGRSPLPRATSMR